MNVSNVKQDLTTKLQRYSPRVRSSKYNSSKTLRTPQCLFLGKLTHTFMQSHLCSLKKKSQPLSIEEYYSLLKKYAQFQTKALKLSTTDPQKSIAMLFDQLQALVHLKHFIQELSYKDSQTYRHLEKDTDLQLTTTLDD